jgi:hypothetical protein
MKTLKMLGFAFVVTTAIACFGSGGASATVLCKTPTNPCGSDYPSGTEIHIVATAPVVIKNLEGSIVAEEKCPKQTTQGKTTNTGGATSTVEVKVEALTWTECTHIINTLAPGALEIHYTSAGNGTLTSKNAEWKWDLGQLDGTTIQCWYTTGTGTDIGTLKGGEKATIEVKAIMRKKEGSALGCWEETEWTGTYEITTPAPLYVSSF